MLLQLTVRNLALIDYLNMEFTDGFNVLTGETGAGKSIIVDSLKLALGGKNERDLLRRGANSAGVEATFDLTDNEEALSFLEKEQLPMEEDRTVVLSRELTGSGRSVCRINGVLVAASVVKQFSELLIDIYGQHDHQSLLNPASHLSFLDASDETGKITELTKELAKKHRCVGELRARQKKNDMDPRERERRLDMLRYQRDEIDGARLTAGEEEELTRYREKLVASEDIIKSLAKACDRISDSGECAVDAVSDAADAMGKIAQFDPVYDELQKELSDILYRLEDAGRALKEASYEADFDENALHETEERLEEIFALKRKYGASVEAVLAFRDEAAAEIDRLENSEKDALELEREISREIGAYYDLAKKVSDLRKKAAKKLEKALLAQLAELGMEKTCFEVEFAPFPTLDDTEKHMTAAGLDTVTFLISPNPGVALKPLNKTVSGGELSRLMLALKTVVSGGGVSAMVFDEIDSGIGGTTGWVIGRKMAAIGKSRQVLCVTHLPQVAALADGHWNVGKSTVDGETRTAVTRLDADGCIAEIARMLGGKKDEQSYLTHAKEMLRQAKEEI